MRRTKIVCTIGPASRSREVIAGLIQAGMNVARLNFSHGSHEEHGQVVDLVRQVAGELGARVAILQDLQGPKIRIGALAVGAVHLRRGEEVTPTEVRCTVARGGLISGRSGLNLPGVRVSAPSLTEKDVADLRFGI